MEVVHGPLQRMLDTYIKWANGYCIHLNEDKPKFMIVANKGKLNSIIDPAPNTGNRRILFVSKFLYLGILVNIKLLFELLYKIVCKWNRSYLCYVRSGDISLTMPLFDYSGSLFLTCNLGQKKELQRM